jgi:YesN/AraC family two-component response regulator
MMLLFDNEIFQIHQNVSWLFAITIVALLVLLFLEPSILYGTGILVNSATSQRSYTPIEESEAKKYREAIEKYFLTVCNFLRDDFRQQDLADYLKITKNKLSQVISQLYGQNFNQMINEKRILVAIEKLRTKEGDNLTLEGIAQDVGFKSRTTFIKAFQEKTGLSPSEFRKKVLNR